MPGFIGLKAKKIFETLYFITEDLRPPRVGLSPPGWVSVLQGRENVTIILPIWNIQLVAELCVYIWTHFNWLPLLTFILSLFWMLCNIITSPVVQLTNRFAFTQNNLMPYGLLVVHKAIQQISAIQHVLATSKNCLDALSSFVPWTTTTTSVEGLIYGHFAWTDLIQKCIKSLTPDSEKRDEYSPRPSQVDNLSFLQHRHEIS